MPKKKKITLDDLQQKGGHFQGGQKGGRTSGKKGGGQKRQGSIRRS